MKNNHLQSVSYFYFPLIFLRYNKEYLLLSTNCYAQSGAPLWLGNNTSITSLNELSITSGIIRESKFEATSSEGFVFTYSKNGLPFSSRIKSSPNN